MPNESHKRQPQPDICENRLSQAAGNRRGIVTTEDVRAAGLDREAVRVRVNAQRLHPMFPGVWALGHTGLTREAWQHAGVLSVGGDALLDGASACQLYEVFRRRIGKVHVVTSKHARSHGRLKVRQADRMPRRCKRKGIPVVSIEEALLGLAANPDVTDDEVRKALRRSMTESHTTLDRLKRQIDRSNGRPGVRRLRALLGEGGERSRSVLEAGAAAMLRRYGVAFKQNVEIDGEEADLVLEDGTIVELDSETFHDNPISAAGDTRRQDHWESRGRRVERLTWDDVHARPVRTVRRLTAPVASLA
jgi:hypothetical protein